MDSKAWMVPPRPWLSLFGLAWVCLRGLDLTPNFCLVFYFWTLFLILVLLKDLKADRFFSSVLRLLVGRSASPGRSFLVISLFDRRSATRELRL